MQDFTSDAKENLDSNLLVGLDASDDCGVYKLNSEIALIQTVDFFTPVVDDPYIFGQIAAANALSDVYAMGAKPVTCLNLLAFPIDKLGTKILKDILKGGSDKIKEAGAHLVGGHSITDSEPKYGLSVTGVQHPDKVITNSDAKPGDYLILTKPLGVGIITTAIKKGLAKEEDLDAVIKTMTRLNKDAGEVLEEFSVSACTDITGFGLLGHTYEMAKGSEVTIELDVSKVPVLAGTKKYVENKAVAGGTKKNLSYFSSYIEGLDKISEGEQYIIADAITSGGLLIAINEDECDQLINKLKEQGCLSTEVVGKVLEKDKCEIKIK
ncbi:Selenide, water dikinase [Natranaerofaba carboxydovora]|nr:Selenide, water dikinase [Natranaerofaba carboxydovora]